MSEDEALKITNPEHWPTKDLHSLLKEIKDILDDRGMEGWFYSALSLPEATKFKRVLNVEIKTSWGKELVYPLDDTGKLLVKLTNKETFTPDDVKILKQLNYEFAVKPKLL